MARKVTPTHARPGVRLPVVQGRLARPIPPGPVAWSLAQLQRGDPLERERAMMNAAAGNLVGHHTRAQRLAQVLDRVGVSL